MGDQDEDYSSLPIADRATHKVSETLSIGLPRVLTRIS